MSNRCNEGRNEGSVGSRVREGGGYRLGAKQRHPASVNDPLDCVLLCSNSTAGTAVQP
jgi:hypothetical protein